MGDDVLPINNAHLTQLQPEELVVMKIKNCISALCSNKFVRSVCLCLLVCVYMCVEFLLNTIQFFLQSHSYKHFFQAVSGEATTPSVQKSQCPLEEALVITAPSITVLKKKLISG